MVITNAALSARRTRGRSLAGNTVVAAGAGTVLAAIVVLALFPSLLVAADPRTADPAGALRVPSAEHPFGTDQLGRGVFSRVVHGARTSLLLGVGAVVVRDALRTN